MLPPDGRFGGDCRGRDGGQPVGAENALAEALAYGNHSTFQEHQGTVWEEIAEDQEGHVLSLGRSNGPKSSGSEGGIIGGSRHEKNSGSTNDYSVGPRTAREKGAALTVTLYSKISRRAWAGKPFPSCWVILCSCGRSTHAGRFYYRGRG